MRRLLAFALPLLVMLGGTSSALAQSASLERISRASPFAANCGGPAAGGTLFTNAEVEPWVSANPKADRNLVAVWQQDRWSNGGAQGNLTGVSFDRGGSWQRPTPPPFSRCAGGNAANGGDYDRASDPWVSFGGDGSAHQIALAVERRPDRSARSSSRARATAAAPGAGSPRSSATPARRCSTTRSRSRPIPGTAASSTRSGIASRSRTRPTRPRRSRATRCSPARPTAAAPGSRTRTILDFPDNSNIQTLGNQIVVLSDGTLVNIFDLIDRGLPLVAVQRSTDHGATWSAPIIVDVLFSSAVQGQGVVDPFDLHPVRTGDLLPEAAADPRRRSDDVHIVWQDIRFTLAAPLPIFNDQIVIASSTRRRADVERPEAHQLEQAHAGVHRLGRRRRARERRGDVLRLHRRRPERRAARQPTTGSRRRATAARRSRRGSG